MEEDGIENLGDLKFEERGDEYERWDIHGPIYSIKFNVKGSIYGIQAVLRSPNTSTESTQLYGTTCKDCDKREIVFWPEEKVTQVQISYHPCNSLASFTIITDRQVFGPIGTPRTPNTRKVIYDFSPGTFAGLFGWTYVMDKKIMGIMCIGFLKHTRELMWEHGNCLVSKNCRVSKNFGSVGEPMRLGDKKLDASGRYKGWEISMPIYSIKVYVTKHAIWGIQALHPSSFLTTVRTDLYGGAPPDADHRELVFGPNEKVLQVSIAHYKKSKNLATFTIKTNKQVFGPIGTLTEEDFETVTRDCEGSFAGLFGYTYDQGKQFIASIGLLKQEKGFMLGCSTCLCSPT